MNGLESLFLRAESTSLRINIAQFWEFDERIPIAQLHARLAETVERHPRLRCKIVLPLLGNARVEPDLDFSLSRHVSVIDLPATKPHAEALKKAIESVVQDHSSLVLSQSPWRVYLCNHAHGPGCTIIWKTHHCLVDGHSLVALSDELLDGSDPVARDRVDCAPSSPQEGQMQFFWKQPLWSVVPQAFEIFRAASGLKFVSRVLWPQTPIVPLEGLGANKHYSAVPLLRLDAIEGARKEIRTKLKVSATVNDVLLAIVAGGLRSFISTMRQIPANEIATLLVPVDMHSAGEQTPTPGEPMFNEVGAVLIDAPVGEASRSSRIRNVCHQTALAKRSGEAAFMNRYVHLSGLWPSRLVRALTPQVTRGISAACTNVRVAQNTRHFLGKAIREWHMMIPAPGAGPLGVAMLTYGNDISIGLSADCAVVPNLDGLAQCIAAEAAALSAEFCHQAISAKL
eukprot:TRINITY_DN13591_c0_g1_i1.p1 TRINITY_DN13591_c0_g1~~TRINITY_DN13591_c0_g1_i1.p1  ORF type:complete len:465 (+),score=59.31 TRINITY_DN13591_c0_g1_i1:33-1397(+)